MCLKSFGFSHSVQIGIALLMALSCTFSTRKIGLDGNGFSWRDSPFKMHDCVACTFAPLRGHHPT